LVGRQGKVGPRRPRSHGRESSAPPVEVEHSAVDLLDQVTPIDPNDDLPDSLRADEDPAEDSEDAYRVA
jgi:hypothetical protein